MKFVIQFIKDNKTMLPKYIVVGGTSATIDFGLYVLFTDVFNLYYILAATLSFIVAALYNFTLNRKWTFKSNGKKRKQMPVFFTITVSGLLINNGIIFMLVEYAYLWDILAKIIATGIVTMWNFVGNRYITFRKQDNEIREDTEQRET